MSALIKVCIFLYIAACCVQADKYTDENRTYEFGFTIEGEQHRHEKKDENGIIMGEFGFITADGVYHVTVYATDENGNFKIISMKNIRVKPYPTAPNQNLRQGHSLTLPSSAQTNAIAKTNKGALQLKHQDNSLHQTKTIAKTNNGAQSPKQEDNSGPAKTCSHCSVPTTTTPSPKLPIEKSAYGNNQQTENKFSTQLQSNSNSFDRENNLQQNFQQNNIPEKTGTDLDNYNPNQITSKNKGAAGQQNTQKFNYNQPSREISTPAISNYPQSYNKGQTIPVQSGDEPYNLHNSPQTFGNYPQTPNLGQQQSQGSPRLSSNSEDNYPQIQQQQPNIAGPGQIPSDNGVVSNKDPLNTYNANQKLPFNNEQNNEQQNNIPQNNLNVNRQPKSFNDILESVTPDNKYNIDIESPVSSQSGISTPSEKPVLIAAQMQLVDKNTDVYHKNPGEKDGLPQGLTQNDMNQLLYTFNYTLGFHGHHEEGYRNGVKIGYYFVTGRNGVRTRVDYTADETGFHPRISHEILDILSDDVPKPETEKEDKYGLKGYEFKWLYYPVDSS